MKTKLLKIEKTTILSKQEQKNITGGFWGGGSSECLYTGCFTALPGGNGFVGFEGGPCALDTPTPQACIGIVRNNQCCIG